MSIALDARSEPEPDIAIVPGSLRDYRDAHPTNALLVVEVADTSLANDQGLKAKFYAKNGIPEYWILNLNKSLLEVYRKPDKQSESYQMKTVLSASELISPHWVHEVSIHVSDIMP